MRFELSGVQSEGHFFFFINSQPTQNFLQKTRGGVGEREKGEARSGMPSEASNYAYAHMHHTRHGTPPVPGVRSRGSTVMGSSRRKLQKNYYR